MVAVVFFFLPPMCIARNLFSAVQSKHNRAKSIVAATVAYVVWILPRLEKNPHISKVHVLFDVPAIVNCPTTSGNFSRDMHFF